MNQRAIERRALLRGIYAITDAKLIPSAQFDATVATSLEAGIRLLQYRDKGEDRAQREHQALALRRLCDQHGALLIVNDDPELALTVEAHGVHIGADDPDLAGVRQRLGGDRIIGVSCYNRLELALAAEAGGADYVAFGRFFPSSTKPNSVPAKLELLSQARRQLRIPICAIGGIDASNLPQVVRHGADMAAVVAALFGAPDLPAAVAALQRSFALASVME